MGRAPCCDKANVKKGPWSPEEDSKLKDYIEKWEEFLVVTKQIEMGRAPCCDKANVKKGPWSPEEDSKLKDHIEKWGELLVVTKQMPRKGHGLLKKTLS
ncbi:hypothetical protein PVK06_009649 [Gossypium arboreum]|uniref:Myb-like domain-containing protein n=1 Tax=Gossypium arboreum TaxID=29729 RepID=A0ABR0QN38_GOSAR|nr:hypothetical protein PVK06_009649 [Gossypium arboreum]